MLKKLRSILDWDEFVSFDDIDDCVDCLNSVVSGAIDLLFPVKCFRIKKRGLPWSISPEARRCRQERDRAHRTAVKVNTASAWAMYRKLRNKAMSILRKLKAQYFSGLAEEKKPQFWKNVSFLTSSKVKKPISTSFSCT